MTFSKRLIAAGVPPSWARLLGLNPEDGIVAAGTTQGTATQLTQQINRITSTPAGTGVRLPSFSADISNICIVKNSGANTLTVYPSSGEEIDNLGTDVGTPILTAGSGIVFCRISELRWAMLFS